VTDLLALLSELGRWALPAVWLPVLVWTLVAGAALVSLRLVRPVHAVIAYPLHLALLLGLPLVLLARSLTRTLAPSSVSTAIGSVLLPPVAASNGATGFEAPLLPLAAGLGVIVALAVTLGGFLRLALAARRLQRYGQALVPDAALQDAVDAERVRLGVGHAVRAVRAPEATVPFTFGVRRPVVVVPGELADRPDALRLALGHELVHVRRHVFAVNLLAQAVGAAFRWHPLVPLLQRRLVLLREAVCDAEVLAHRPRERRAYADLLLSFALSASPPLALAASTDRSFLHQRLIAMTRPPKSRIELAVLRRSARGLALALSLLLVLAVALVAGSPNAFAQTDTTRAEQKDRDAYVMVDEPPVLIGGLEGLLEELRYPALARQAGIQGTIFVQFVVDESGVPVDAEVVRSTANAADGDGGLAAEALRVVRQARFEPGRHEGEPVKVGFTLPIRFELPGGSASPTPEGSGAPSPVQRLFDRWEEHNDERHDEEHR